MSFDLFGDGKTALKATFGRFIAGQGAGPQGIGANNPVVRSVLSVTRTWTDRNTDFIVNCDLKNPLLNDECGQIDNLNFGQNNPNATTYAPELTTGSRPYNWEMTSGVTRELFSGVSITGSYSRRVFGNFRVNDNQFVTPSAYKEYCVTAPSSQGLPGGGGERICGLYDVAPELFGRSQIVVSPAEKFGKQSQVYDGVDLTERIRLRHGVLISGGLNWGRTRTNTCFVIDSPQVRFCDVTPPFLPNASFVGVVPLPWWGLVSSATYRNFPGPEYTATQQFTNAEILPSLNRNLAQGANGTVNVELIQPGSLYGPRLQQIDLRLSKRLRLAQYRLAGNLDLINLLNAAGVKTINTTFGPNWKNGTLVQSGRYAKFSIQIDF